MDALTKATVTRILECGGFITALDMATLLADDATRTLPTIIRYHDGERVRTPLNLAFGLIARAGDDLRDVCFPSDVYATLNAEVNPERNLDGDLADRPTVCAAAELAGNAAGITCGCAACEAS
jgi:hypothetical protein